MFHLATKLLVVLQLLLRHHVLGQVLRLAWGRRGHHLYLSPFVFVTFVFVTCMLNVLLELRVDHVTSHRGNRLTSRPWTTGYKYKKSKYKNPKIIKYKLIKLNK